MTLMRRWFESLDADGSGEVGLNELEDPLVSVGLARNREDVQKLIDGVDKEGKGEVTFDEFLNLMYPKKVKRSRQREPLHQPKTRVIVEAQLTNATQSKAGLPRQPTTPLSSPRGPSSPQGYNAGVISSPRGSPRRVVSCHSSARTKKLEPKVNPVVKLFEDLQSGKLGDLAIPFPVLITAYRRRMLLNAHMADDPTARR
uniref:EF-hand domain-containing protein n=1 Tax=Globisporangium ultimum (strain ATCC 200006 / CBS 805.95 / DAOM BR144) TaxID=431595 RepID=K3X9X3_GLOUD